MNKNVVKPVVFLLALWLLPGQLQMTADAHASGAPPLRLEITLAHDNLAERQTRDALIALSAQYDLTKWTWTRRIVIEQYAIPHSDPVLTLNTRHQDLALLSSYIHEQLHRFEDMHSKEMDLATAEFRRRYPGLPVGGLEGANGETSTYLHIITCYSEYQAMKRLVGPEKARAVISELAADHYRAIYNLVLDQEQSIASVVQRYGLMPD